MLRSMLLASLLGVCTLASTFAQDSAVPQHKKLKDLEGTWSFVLKSEGAPDSKGTSVYKMECGDMWLVSEMNTEFAGTKFQGRGMDGYDIKKKKYVSVWVDSMTSAPMFFEGDFDSKGEKLEMTSKSPGPNGTAGTWRSVTKVVDANKHTFEMYFKPDGGQETQLMTVTYTRQK